MAAIWSLIGNKSIVTRIRDTYKLLNLLNDKKITLYQKEICSTHFNVFISKYIIAKTLYLINKTTLVWGSCAILS